LSSRADLGEKLGVAAGFGVKNDEGDNAATCCDGILASCWGYHMAVMAEGATGGVVVLRALAAWGSGKEATRCYRFRNDDDETHTQDSRLEVGEAERALVPTG
jgi:hypothetical protein